MLTTRLSKPLLPQSDPRGISIDRWNCIQILARMTEEKKRTCNVSLEGKSLANWVNTQRKDKTNAQLNTWKKQSINDIHENFFVINWQFARLPIGDRGKRKYTKYTRQHFEIIVIPSRFAKGSYGAMDLIRNYQNILKPCLYIIKLRVIFYLCTNHVVNMNINDWARAVQACCIKNERTIESIDIIRPDADFPSFDNQKTFHKTGRNNHLLLPIHEQNGHHLSFLSSLCEEFLILHCLKQIT